jgi:hypothetical protein
MAVPVAKDGHRLTAADTGKVVGDAASLEAIRKS